MVVDVHEATHERTLHPLQAPIASTIASDDDGRLLFLGDVARPAGLAREAVGVRARLLRVRRLSGGQRQQQLPHDLGARRLAAVRDRLPDAPRHRPLLQRQKHPRHHQRAPRRRAHAAVPEPRAPGPEAARRRQLRVGRRRDPQRHRHPVRGHPQDEPAAEVLRRVPGQAAGAGGCGPGAAGGPRLPYAHHPRRQRLREQLLPRPLLPALPPVRAAGLRALHRLRVQEDPHQAVRDGLPPRPCDGHGPPRVRAGDPGAAQPQRRVRGGADARRVALQPAAGARAGRAQPAVRRRHVHRGQRVPCPLRLRERPRRVRVRDGQGRVLRAGPPQRAGAVHGGVKPVRRPGPLRVLGRVPPHGARQPHHRQSVHGRVARLREPHEPQHRPRDGREGGRLIVMGR